MKYPTNTNCLAEARMYAIDSLDHTYDYDGWGDAWHKSQRIITGKFCQLWLGEYCKLNNVPYKKDRSSPYISDSGDLHINGWNIDCKASTSISFCGQISPHFDKDKEIDFYSFFLIDKNFSFIEPLGFINKINVIENSIKVLKGEKIPNTDIIQKFESHSYFVNLDKLTAFDYAISAFIGMPNKKMTSREWVKAYDEE